MEIKNEFLREIQLVDQFLTRYCEQEFPETVTMPGVKAFHQSIRYSLLGGGKRFRPVLSLLTAQALKLSEEKVLPFAAAVEMVHTYSLIHDDLPCMDDDDERRGQPTNHKIFGEGTALLAGDALLTEANRILARYYGNKPTLACDLLHRLSSAAGAQGMIQGQIIDIAMEKVTEISEELLRTVHHLKTGRLISVSVEGVAMIAGLATEGQDKLRVFAESLGLAFQITDDILDFDPKNPEPSGFPTIIGLEATKDLLADLTQQALTSITFLGEEAYQLRKLVMANQQRTI